MEQLKTKVSDLADHAGDILDTYFKLTQIKVLKKTAKAATAAITFFVIAAFCLCILLFIGVGLALWLGTVMNSAAAYFVVAAFYLLLIAVFWMLRRKLIFPVIMDFLARKFYD